MRSPVRIRPSAPLRSCKRLQDFALFWLFLQDLLCCWCNLMISSLQTVPKINQIINFEAPARAENACGTGVLTKKNCTAALTHIVSELPCSFEKRRQFWYNAPVVGAFVELCTGRCIMKAGLCPFPSCSVSSFFNRASPMMVLYIMRGSLSTPRDRERGAVIQLPRPVYVYSVTLPSATST